MQIYKAPDEAFKVELRRFPAVPEEQEAGGLLLTAWDYAKQATLDLRIEARHTHCEIFVEWPSRGDDAAHLPTSEACNYALNYISVFLGHDDRERVNSLEGLAEAIELIIAKETAEDFQREMAHITFARAAESNCNLTQAARALELAAFNN